MIPHRLFAALLAAAALLACGASAQTRTQPDPRMVAVGPHLKPVFGTILRMEAGDRACYVTIRDDRGVELQELAGFEVCEQAETLLNRRVELAWKMGKVLAASCQGDMDCGKSDIVALIESARVLR